MNLPGCSLIRKLTKKENDRIINELINELPEIHEQILTLYYGESKPYKMIAQELDIPLNTVKTRLSNAKKELKKRILSYEDKHNIRLHTTDIFNNLKNIIHTSGNSVSSGAANTVSNSLASSITTKISIATSAIAVAVCAFVIGNYGNHETIRNQDAMTDIPAAVEEQSETEDVPPQNNRYQMRDGDTSVVYQESQVIVENDPETSVVYVPVDQNVPDSTPETIVKTETVTEKVPETVVEKETETIPQTVTDTTTAKDYTQYEDITYGDYQVRVFYANNEAMLLSYSGAGGDVVLPSAVPYNGKQVNVTMISRNLFDDYRYSEYDDTETTVKADIVSVTLPEHLTEIPGRSFYLLKKLTAVNGGNEVTRIGTEAFSYTALTEMNFNKNFSTLQEIDSRAFYECENLKTVVMPENCFYVDKEAFSGIALSDLTVIYNPKGLGYNLSDFAYYTGISDTTLHIILTGDTITFPQPVSATNKYAKEDENKGGWTFSKVIIETENPDVVIRDPIGKLLGKGSPDQLCLPECMTEIRSNEFEDTYAPFSTITIPASITKIDAAAFADVTDHVNFKCIEVAENNPAYYAQDGVLYSKNGRIVYFPNSKKCELEKYRNLLANYPYKDKIGNIELTEDISDLSAVIKEYPNLWNIDIPENNPYFSVEESGVYNKDQTEFLYYPGGIRSDELILAQNCIYINYEKYGSQGEFLPGNSHPECVKKIQMSGNIQNLSSITEECINLEKITFYSDTEIAPYSIGYKKVYTDGNNFTYEKLTGLVIEGTAGSAAETYAIENGFEFVDLNASEEYTEYGDEYEFIEGQEEVYD